MKQNPHQPAGRPKKFVRKENLIENIKDNIAEAEVSMEFALPEEFENLKDKNQRRRHELQRLKDEPLS
nr:hypothetical protein [Lysinibacillus timonensis]